MNYESTKVSGENTFVNNYVTKVTRGVIFDVGANIGLYSTKLREANPGVVIYAFEPHPVTFKRLLSNTNKLNIKINNVGVGAINNTLKLYDYADNDGSTHASFYKDVIETIHKGRVVEHEVKVITLDGFVRSNKIDRVTLLKIDTEGHELEVMKGFEEFIKAGKVDIIHFEFNEMNIASRVFFKDFWDFLPNYNFYRMLPNGLAPIKSYSPVFCEIFAYQNIVAMLKKE